MINIAINFQIFEYWGIILDLFILLSVAVFFFCQWCKNKDAVKIVFYLFLFLSVGLIIAGCQSIAIDQDELENLHCSWMISNGLVPFRDFWQHHSPLFWLILAPLIKLFKPSMFILDISRIFSLSTYLVSCFLGWRIAKAVWKESAQVSLYLLIFASVALRGQFYCLRPDMFMILLLLLGVRFTLMVPQGGLLPVFCAGMSMALAESFAPKQFLLLLLPMIAIVAFTNKNRLLKIIVYGLGLAVGVAPLLIYLIHAGILKDFLFWVFTFNIRLQVLVSDFPLLMAGLAVWSSVFLIKRYKELKHQESLILFFAFLLSTLSTLNVTIAGLSKYYNVFWCILCAIVCCSLNFSEVLKPVKSMLYKGLIVGVVGGILLMPNMRTLDKKNVFKSDKKEINKILRISRNGSVFVLLYKHPIFAYDVSRLYAGWQLGFMKDYKNVVEDTIQHGGVVDSIIAGKPSIIQESTSDKGWLFIELVKDQVITLKDYQRLRRFFIENYRVRFIGDIRYEVRNDIKIKSNS